MAKRRLSNFDFSCDGAHVALVDKGANGQQILIMKAEFSADDRKKLAESGAAMPDGSYPIRNKADLSNAIQAFGRAKDKPATARHIKRRAAALGATDMLPTDGALANLMKSWEVVKAYADRQIYDSAKGEYRAPTESGFRVNLSLEDALMMIRDLYPENIECLTNAITKSANGAELVVELRKSLTEVPNATALGALDKAALDSLVKLINLNHVEKSNMSSTATPVTPEAVQKQIDAAVAASNDQVAKLTKALADSEAARTALAADTAVLKAAHEAREAQAFVAKAESLSKIGFGDGNDAAKVGAALQKLAKAAPAEYALIEKMLVTAADTITKGLGDAGALVETGHEGTPTYKSAADKLAKAAEDLRKADAKLSPEQAVTKALENDPDLYEALR